MSASCLAVHPEKNSVACGTAAGKLVLLALPGGELLLDVSSCKTAVAGLSYGPSGRWLAVRERSGRVGEVVVFLFLEVLASQRSRFFYCLMDMDAFLD